MAIKRIQLRGISRTPSDRMTAAGGCTESLNVQLQDQECAPVVAPERLDVLPDYFYGRVLFIHKGNDYENYIGLEGGALKWLRKDERPVTLMTGVTEDVRIFSSGNTIMAVYNGTNTRILFNEGKYEILGSRIPFPEAEFILDFKPQINEPYTIIYQPGGGSGTGFDVYKIVDGAAPHIDFPWLPLNYFNYEGKVPYEDVDDADALNEVRYIKTVIQSHEERLRSFHNVYTKPVMLKYSLVLYDGTEIDSDTFLAMPNPDYHMCSLTSFKVTGSFNRVSSTRGHVWFKINQTFTMPYNPVFNFGDSAFQELATKWKDVVKSFRVYISQDIEPEPIDTYTGLALDNRDDNSEWEDNVMNYDATGDAIIYEHGFNKENFKANGVFNLYKEFTIDEMNENPAVSVDYMSNTDRALEDTFQMPIIPAKDQYIARNYFQFNGRLFGYDVETIPFGGTRRPQGWQYDMSREDSDLIRLWYVISNYSSSPAIVGGRQVEINANIPAYITYSNPSCRRIYLHSNNRGWFEISPEQHSAQLMAYFLNTKYQSLGTMLDAVLDGENVSGIKALPDGFELPAYGGILDETNKIYYTGEGGVFSFVSAKTLSAPVVGMSVNTVALSAGQHGDAPLLAFTKDGIYGLFTNDEGAIMKADPLPRDIAIEGRIWQIDNATVFLTDKGVQIIQGSQVHPLSEAMLGKPYMAEQKVLDILAGAGHAGLAHIVGDSDTTFMSFMYNASMCNDYNGKRLIFFNPDKDYAYVYSMQTQTWHKLSLPAGLEFGNTLNSYPEAQVVLRRNAPTFWVDEYHGSVDLDDDQMCGTLALSIQSEAQHDGVRTPDLSLDQWLLFLRGQMGFDQTGWSQTELDGFGALMDRFEFVTVTELNYRMSAVYDFSTILTDADLYKNSAQETACVIATRPFDLDAPDILKSISQLRIRGDFERYDSQGKPRVGYILLGSQDGIHFSRLTSLRGKAWKLFRIVILAKLRPYERVSYIDIQYETRLENKLR